MRLISPPVPVAPIKTIPDTTKLQTFTRNFDRTPKNCKRAFAQKYERKIRHRKKYLTIFYLR